MTVTCWMLRFSRQPYYRCLANGHRLLADEARNAGEDMSDRTAWMSASVNGWLSALGKPKRGKGRRPGPPVHDNLCTVVGEDGRTRHVFGAKSPNELWLIDLQCRRRHCRSYADLGTMPMLLKDVQVSGRQRNPGVGIVAGS